MSTKICMTGRSLLTLHDLADEEMLSLIALAGELKAAGAAGRGRGRLEGKTVALLFEKSSTRTRCAAAVAAAHEGGTTEYLAAGDIHLGKKESVADTARVLGRMFDGIMFRGFKQETVEALAAHSGLPVWNGLTDAVHPTQVLADLLTLKEVFGRLEGLRVAYIGDGRNNVAMSLMTGCAKAGVHIVNGTPAELAPPADEVARISEIAAGNGSTVRVVRDPAEAVAGANAVYTDVWVSMGEESRTAKRVKLLRPYQVNMELMRRTGNLDGGDVIFLHCLPAYHDSNTDITRDTGAMEVTDEVFEAPFSHVFDEAENRVHTIKALFLATLT